MATVSKHYYISISGNEDKNKPGEPCMSLEIMINTFEKFLAAFALSNKYHGVRTYGRRLTQDESDRLQLNLANQYITTGKNNIDSLFLFSMSGKEAKELLGTDHPALREPLAA